MNLADLECSILIMNSISESGPPCSQKRAELVYIALSLKDINMDAFYQAFEDESVISFYMITCF